MMPINRSPNRRSGSSSTIEDTIKATSDMSAVQMSSVKRGRPPKDDKDKKERDRLGSTNNNNDIINQLSSLIDDKNSLLKQELIEQQKKILDDNYNQIRNEHNNLKLLIDEKLNAQAEKYCQLRDHLTQLIDDKFNNQTNLNEEFKAEINLLIDTKMSQFDKHVNEISTSINGRLDACESNIILYNTELHDITTKFNDLDKISTQHISSVNEELDMRLNCLSNIIISGVPEAIGTNVSANNCKNSDTA
ncbi:hypothetical protein HCN44_011042 [Aphidius gifuensis]|uniref:Uncharacterized protein n=1 Tax=Aphidius gifuensis TaxID=684658 RepID=A0A834XJL5_APHGI|nr:hypothetical protein HCN44_011042 [Aphidius gifuensis]